MHSRLDIQLPERLGVAMRIVTLALLSVACPARPALACDEESVVDRLQGAEPTERRDILAELLSHAMAGPDREVAISLLMQAIERTTGDCCADVARHVGTLARHHPGLVANSLPTLESILDKQHGKPLCEVISVIGNLGPLAKSTIPRLERLLNQEGQFALFYNVHAAGAILRIDPTNSSAVLTLQRLLSSSDRLERWLAASAIAYARPSEKWVLDPLRSLLNDNDVTVRAYAAGALWRSAGDVKESLPVLLSLT